jgi:hypothetical protein
LERFVMVRVDSRDVFAPFTVDQTLENFLRGRVDLEPLLTNIANAI